MAIHLSFALALLPFTILTTMTSSTTSAAAYTLITFDVDGTLVHSTQKSAQGGDQPPQHTAIVKPEPSAHSRAFAHAVGEILGGGDTAPVPPVHALLPREHVSGSTDGLILLRLARAALDKQPAEAMPQLDALMDAMDAYVAALDDEEIARGIQPLPGVLETLKILASLRKSQSSSLSSSSSSSPNVICGLVTGNVEGVARRKMRATGILATGALAPPASDQLAKSWTGSDSSEIAFLGGFGSDFCSGDIDDMERNHLDRAQQIAICADRCRALLLENNQRDKPLLKRVVHVGDAPADVLAAKAYSEQLRESEAETAAVYVGMVAVATGKYSVQELADAAGENVPGKWECVILKNGMADPPAFLRACGVRLERPYH